MPFYSALWLRSISGDHVLDIGTGTGVLALMAAQLGAGKVTAVELTQQAYQEADINFSNSPWAERLEVVHQDIQSFALTADRQYDLIISNPPFFENHSKTVDTLEKYRQAHRSTALCRFDQHCRTIIIPAGFVLSVDSRSCGRQVFRPSFSGGILLDQANRFSRLCA